MSDRHFIDTNIFVYCFDPRERLKQARSLQLIENALETKQGLISYQVVQEFLNLSTGKFQKSFTSADREQFIHCVLAPLCEVWPSMDLYNKALDIHQRTGFSFYDSLIVAGAIQSGCKILYTEDLQSDRIIDGVKITNPFDE